MYLFHDPLGLTVPGKRRGNKGVMCRTFGCMGCGKFHDGDEKILEGYFWPGMQIEKEIADKVSVYMRGAPLDAKLNEKLTEKLDREPKMRMRVAEIMRLKKELQSEKHSAEDLRTLIESTKAQIIVSKEDFAEANRSLTEQEKIVDGFLAEKRELINNLDQTRKKQLEELDKLKADHKAKEDELDNTKREILGEMISIQNHIDGLCAEVVQAEANVESMKKRIADAEGRVSKGANDLERLKQKQSDMEVSIKIAKENVPRLEEQLKNAEALVENEEANVKKIMMYFDRIVEEGRKKKAAHLEELKRITHESNAVIGQIESAFSALRETKKYLSDVEQENIAADALVLARIGENAKSKELISRIIRSPRAKAKDQCPICMEDTAKKIALVRCGHFGFCGHCADLLEKCPYCRSDVGGRLKLFSP